MHTRPLGSTGPQVSAVGLGCMGMSALYGDADRSESITTIHAALEAGVTLFDTGDFYVMGHNEMLIDEALRTAPAVLREQALTSVKFGALRDPAGGFFGYVGLSEAGADTIRQAAATAPIVDLQIEYSLISRGIEDRILPTTRELGIGITAYGVLSRGLISGHFTQDRQLAANDFRAHAPRFQGENLQHNLGLVEAVRKIAEQKGATVAQIAIAWVLSRGEDIVPLVGARRRDRLTEALGALDVTLEEADLAAIEEAVPAGAAAGERYPEAQMVHLDSER